MRREFTEPTLLMAETRYEFADEIVIAKVQQAVWLMEKSCGSGITRECVILARAEMGGTLRRMAA